MTQPIVFHPIGIIHSPFKEPVNMPIQPAGAKGIRGQVELLPEFCEGLDDIDGFSHIYLIYFLHKIQDYRLKVKPYLDHVKRGVFATRAPHRPNAIGLSLVKLIRREGCVLTVENIDVIDGTPLLDIKPYVPHMYDTEDMRYGWLERYLEKFKTKKS
ncbi:MAG TPA: tRNA (N6-threonylcarbamoyladenosine(37)-N6)-methyltransferase TrmO [Caldithrix abyssi]|uniref:tRNA (N6-threonylcarbamoyladenosine(37)-N6)-methyltransferase TrmO n=1 Tax=Caldithrix abyssi TaxID=187145 RepID=A0A7V5UF34_CALAY|nr:tRNA (N6-threonylcarbamoyladenosine(37)-N6)-methyltransferase TrmO [Caldithrix abyssi]